MHTHRTPDVALRDRHRALREQWTHEDHLVNQRMGWLIRSEGLMSLFAEPWKLGQEGEVGSQWGLRDKDERRKYGLAEIGRQPENDAEL